MNINDIYNRIFKNIYTKDDLDWLLNNAQALCTSNQFCNIYYEIIKELEKNNENNFINNFILICKNKPFPPFNLFRLSVDKTFATPQNIEQLTLGEHFMQFPNLYKILIKEVKPLCNTDTIKRLIKYYFSALMFEYNLFGEIENIINSIDLEVFSDINDNSFFTECIYNVDFWENELFKNKVLEFFSKHPDKLIEPKNVNISYTSLKFISKNIIYEGMSGKELLNFDTILINECNYKNGLDFSQDSMIKLYNYYHSRNKIHEINNLLSYYLGKNFYNNILNYSKDKEQLISIIMQTNNQYKLFMNLSEANEYYSELCNLNTNRVFVVFSGGYFGSGREEIPFAEYKSAKEFYDNLANEIKQYNFSPLEKYLYAYIKTKTYKNYNYYRGNREQDAKRSQMSRNPFLVVNNNYMVCAGYSNFFLELLNRLDISSSFLHVPAIEVGDLHARILVHLKDTTYNIDGVYIGEVTGGKDAINTKPSCFDAVMTKNKNEYETYQYNKSLKADFLDAIRKLDIEDKYKFDTNPDFFDFINRPIPIGTIKNATINVIRKTNPHLNEEEIINTALKYCDYNSDYVCRFVHTDEMLKKQLNNMKFDNVPGHRFYNFNNFLETQYYNRINFQNITCWNIANKQYRYHILINDKSKRADEIMNILSSNRHLFENEYVQLFYDEEYDYPGIYLLVPQTFTGEMLKNIFSKAAYIINEILSRNITQNQSINNHSTRK